MNISLFSRSLGKIVVAILLLIGAGIIGYRVGSSNTSQGEGAISGEPLVKLSYSGGYLANEEKAMSWKAIYSDGRILEATRDGKITELASLPSSQIATLQKMINAPDFIEAGFPKKEREFCDSSVDGIDTEIQFTRTDGVTVSYSDCLYDLRGDNFHLLTVIDFLTHENKTTSSTTPIDVY